jgi:hypothetical protein
MLGIILATSGGLVSCEVYPAGYGPGYGHSDHCDYSPPHYGGGYYGGGYSGGGHYGGHGHGHCY